MSLQFLHPWTLYKVGLVCMTSDSDSSFMSHHLNLFHVVQASFMCVSVSMFACSAGLELPRRRVLAG